MDQSKLLVILLAGIAVITGMVLLMKPTAHSDSVTQPAISGLSANLRSLEELTPTSKPKIGSILQPHTRRLRALMSPMDWPGTDWGSRCTACKSTMRQRQRMRRP